MTRRQPTVRKYDDLTDQALLQRFRTDGDELALATVVRRHHALVMATCRHLLGNVHDAEDAYQATFLVLVRSSAKIRRARYFRSWLYGVAYRVASRIRQTRFRTGEERAFDVLVSSADPLAEVAEREQLSAVHDAIAKLPSSLREPLILRYLDDRSNEDVADELALTVSAVEGRLKRAKARLRFSLAKSGLMLSVALVTLRSSATEASIAISSAAASEGLLERVLEYGHQQWENGTPSEGVVSQMVREEMNAMLHQSIKSYAVIAATCIAGFGILAGGQFADAQPSDAPSSDVKSTAKGSDFRDSVDGVQTVLTPLETTDPRPSVPIKIDTAQESTSISETTTLGLSPAADDSGARQTILNKLTESTKVDFFEEPLSDAAAYLEALHGIQIEFDQLRLDEIGVSTDTPLTKQVRDVSLRSALRLMLRDLGLEFTIRDEVLVITVEDEIETRIYRTDGRFPIKASDFAEIIVRHITAEGVTHFADGVIVTTTLKNHAKLDKLVAALKR